MISRTIASPVAGVYRMFSDAQQKQQWFDGTSSDIQSYQLDFKVGGRETQIGTTSSGAMHRYDATYFDIVPQQRIVYCYEMFVDDRKLSTSLATVEFEDFGDQTQLTIGESVIFYDDSDALRFRQAGTERLLEKLQTILQSN